MSISSLQKNPALLPQLAKIYQLILGAPDIDQEEFRKIILPAYHQVGQRRTVYASDHDIALRAASFIRRDRLRLGQVGKDIFLDKDLDTVEASNISGGDSHGYIFDSPALLSDIYYLLTQDLSPLQRRLREIKREALAYWLFPK